MKRFVIFAFVAFFSLYQFAVAQSLDYATRENVKVILPTVNNLVTLCNSTENGFISLMKNYGYYEDSGSNGQGISYSNGIDGFLVHASTTFYYFVGGSGVLCWVPEKEMYPTTSINDLYRTLRPYYVGKTEGAEKFAFNKGGKSYAIMIQYQGTYAIRIFSFGSADKRLKNFAN